MARQEDPTRRQVIVGAAVGLLGVAALPGCTSTNDGSSPARDAGQGGAAQDAGSLADGAVASDAGEQQCEPTVAQAEGPFGQDGLQRSNLNLYGHSGVPFSLSGRVLDEACRPLLGAQVLLWHASPSPPGAVPRTLTEDRDYTAAVYDHPLEARQVTPDGQSVPTAERMYYGWMRSDAEGRYRFESLRPGWYLNGSTYRASHLHVQVLVAGAVRLTSQIYFPDDPFNDRDGIFLDCTPTGRCTMAINAQGEGTYDLVLTG